jgi:TolB-like protein
MATPPPSSDRSHDPKADPDATHASDQDGETAAARDSNRTPSRGQPAGVPENADSFAIGDLVAGRYTITRFLGRGGMGEVFAVEDRVLGTMVALKTIRPRETDQAGAAERFKREINVARRVTHPNVCRIFDVGMHRGTSSDGAVKETLFLTMELIEGENLAERVGRGRLTTEEAIPIVEGMAGGLGAAHRAGILHRDFKTANVMLTPSRAVVTDFGLARTIEREPEQESLSGSGMVVGTPAYLSPEQVRGDTLTQASDIYALGLVMYEMVTGRRPFVGASAWSVAVLRLTEPPPSPRSIVPDLSERWDTAIRACLQLNPADRPQTTEAVIDLIKSGPPTGDEARPARRQVEAEGKAALRPSHLVAAAVVGLAALGLWAVKERFQGTPPTAAAKPAADSPRLLAVLPFENITRDGKPGYFGAGMTEEVMNQLAKVNSLRVMSRAAVAKFKDVKADLAVMIRELGIGSVVTGSVREDKDRVRVNVELVDAKSGEQLWSQQYDRDTTDVFAVQSEIALKVADVLKASVTLEEQTRLGKRPTGNLAAYELLVRARTRTAAPGESQLSLINARTELLKQAVALDPQFALAWAALSRQYALRSLTGDRKMLPRGFEAAHTAIALDPLLAQAHHALGLNLFWSGKLRESLDSVLKATKLDPSYSLAFADLSVRQGYAGQLDESLKSAKSALQLTPNVWNSYYMVGGGLVDLCDDARAERFLSSASARFEQPMRLEIQLAYLDWLRGRTEAALDRIGRAVAAHPEDIEGLMAQADLATMSGSKDAPRMTDALQKESADAFGDAAPYTMKVLHAYHLHKAGQTARASALMDEILKANQSEIDSGAEWYTPMLQNAAIHAWRGETALALDWLEKSYTAGFRIYRLLARDRLLVSLHNEPRFTKLVARMDADVAAMRARADYTGLGQP